MKKSIILLLVGSIIFMSGVSVLSAEKKEKEEVKEIKIGKVYFPRAYVHQDKKFNKGVYSVTLKLDGESSSFNVFNKKKELLFNELAIVKKNKGKRKKFNYRFSKEMLRGYEYFRIRVKRPDNIYLAYFLIQKNNKKK